MLLQSSFWCSRFDVAFILCKDNLSGSQLWKYKYRLTASQLKFDAVKYFVNLFYWKLTILIKIISQRKQIVKVSYLYSTMIVHIYIVCVCCFCVKTTCMSNIDRVHLFTEPCFKHAYGKTTVQRDNEKTSYKI